MICLRVFFKAVKQIYVSVMNIFGERCKRNAKKLLKMGFSPPVKLTINSGQPRLLTEKNSGKLSSILPHSLSIVVQFNRRKSGKVQKYRSAAAESTTSQTFQTDTV